MIKVGAHGIYLLGSTGEFYAMDFDEFKAVVEILVSEGEAIAEGDVAVVLE